MIKLLVIDDHSLIRAGLRQIISTQSEIEICAEAANGQQALQLAREHSFDIALLDINLPDRHGLDVLKQLQLEQPALKVLALSVYPEEQYGLRMLKAGAVGYINKQAGSQLIIDAIYQIYRGKKFISGNIAEQLLHNLTHHIDENSHERLSNREYQTLCLIASGKNLTEISEIMSISPKTVSVYRSRMLEKMNLHNNAEIVHYAIAHRLVDSKSMN